MNRTIGLISTNYSVPGFGSVTEVRPAASIPFGGRYRLLDFALSNMVNSRVQTVGLVTPYFYRSIMDHVGAGKPWDLSRKEGGLYILPGTVFGFHEENARFLFRDLLHNLEYLRQGDGDYILVSSGTLVANIDYQPMITKHELEGKPVTLLVGGLHLEAASPERLARTFDELRARPALRLAFCHCTGPSAGRALWREFPDRCLHAHAGAVFALGE